MLLKNITAALLALVCIGVSACTTAQGVSPAPAMTTGQTGGGY